VTIQNFDIDFVTSHFSTCDLGHYIRVIKGASTPELRDLRAQIIVHKRTHRSQIAFSNTPSLTAHDALLKAIDNTLLVRSPTRYKLWSFAMPVRQWLVRTFSGLILKKDENFGAIYTKPNHRESVLHMQHPEIRKMLDRFLMSKWEFLVTSLIAIAAIIVTWLLAA
jgi:hypothetical protein